MTKKIFHAILIAVMVVLLASSALATGALYSYFTSVSKTQLKSELSLAVQGVSLDGKDYLEGLESDEYRITWINKDGTVLYDSEDDDVAGMENHLERAEVQAAIQDGYGESERYSSTMMYRSLYAAKRLDDGTILRISIAQYTILMLVLGMIQPILLIIAAALVISVILAKRLSANIVKPLNAIDLDHPLDNTEYDELSPLLQRLNNQQVELRNQSKDLERNRNELNTIVQNVAEGMILIRTDGTILTINQTAFKLLDTEGPAIDQDILKMTRNLDIQEAADMALKGRKIEKIIEIKGGIYQLSAAPVETKNEIHGAAIVLFDITDQQNAETMRREFTANVSHELKTPLHSISGYAELMKDGLVKNEDQKEFSTKIYNEAQRMIQLVEDIITLSHLDEGAGDMSWETADLYETALLVSHRLQKEADRKQIEIKVSGTHASIKGIPALLETIAYNLIDNAIKYGKENGHVEVTVNNGKNEVELQVKDDGIGISKEDQKRIFERFYRADKSHSRAIGGTGLGLSIVKHAAKIHHAEIELQSHVNEGTVISIHFPKNM